MTHWIDRLTSGIAPRWTLQRIRARVSAELLARHYEAASVGRRTQGWVRSSGDANVAVDAGLAKIRESARDLIRNNPYAASALDTIVDHAIGWGIVAAPRLPAGSLRDRIAGIWSSWADTTACDADGRLDFAGVQKQVMRTVVESGEVLVRRRIRLPEDNLPLPFQLQVLEPDYLDVSRNVIMKWGRIIQGVEFDLIGRRTAYWLFPEHPGASMGATIAGTFGASQRIPASEILHVFKPSRPGQVRAPSWFAPVMLRLKDFDDYEDAALQKQKIAACLAVITSDIDGSSPPLGATTAANPIVDMLEPGMILNVPPGRSISVVQPPTISEHTDYASTVLRAIAAGLGLTYEDICGDYARMPFSAARMSRLRHWARVEDWRWRMLIPQFCDPVWAWAMQTAQIVNLVVDAPAAQWTAPPMPMIEPDKEGLAYQRNIRTGIITLSEAIRERGYEPDATLNEMAADWKKLDKLGLILDCDPRKTTQQGNAQAVPKASTAAMDMTPAMAPNGKGAKA